MFLLTDDRRVTAVVLRFGVEFCGYPETGETMDSDPQKSNVSGEIEFLWDKVSVLWDLTHMKIQSHLKVYIFPHGIVFASQP
jgi:hypothetical protein